MTEDLAHEERVSLGLGMHGAGQVGCIGVEGLAGRRLDEGSDLALVEPDEVEPLDVVLASEISEHFRERVPAAEVRVAIGRNDEHRNLVVGANEMAK